MHLPLFRVFMSRFGRDLNPIRDDSHCWLSNAFTCLALNDTQVSSHVSNIVNY